MCGGRSLRRQIGKRLDTPGRIGCDSAQQLAKLMRRSRVETAISAVRQPRYLTVSVFRDGIIAFLKHKSPHAQKSQLARSLAKMVDGLFHGIPNENQRLYALASGVLAGRDLKLFRFVSALPGNRCATSARPTVRCRRPNRTRGIRSGPGNKQAGCRAHQHSQLPETCRPATRRLYPTLAAGSLWHRAQRSTGHAFPGRSPAPTHERARRTPRFPALTRPAPASAVGLYSWGKFYTETPWRARPPRPLGIRWRHSRRYSSLMDSTG